MVNVFIWSSLIVWDSYSENHSWDLKPLCLLCHCGTVITSRYHQCLLQSNSEMLLDRTQSTLRKFSEMSVIWDLQEEKCSDWEIPRDAREERKLFWVK